MARALDEGQAFDYRSQPQVGEPVLAAAPEHPAAVPEEAPAASPSPALAQAESAQAGALRAEEDLDEVYDPLEPFNEKMFEFNRAFDKYVFKPVAQFYDKLITDDGQVAISNAFDNIKWVPRAVNSLLQGKWRGAVREVSRFLINSTAGLAGLFDPAKDHWGIEKSKEDFGQTLGVWGAGPGFYLVLPLMAPLNVRDGIGKLVDGFLDPLGYVLPFFWDRLGMKVGDELNDRALNLELFQGFEESVIDMYSAVRHGYTKRRETLIKE